MRLEINGEVGVLCVIAEVILFQHGIVEPPGETALLHMLHLQPNLSIGCSRDLPVRVCSSSVG